MSLTTAPKSSATPTSGRKRMIVDGTVVALAVMLVAGASAVLWNLNRLSDRMIESSALEYARILSSTLTEFRTLYTSEVVTVAEAMGIEVTHDYALLDSAIPLPATLSMELGNRIAPGPGGARARLYSPYPFPWREDSGGLTDEFAREAWARLSETPGEPFAQVSLNEGRSVLRFATADVMRADCVGCHNSHPETPKTGWMPGDLRGVLEVTIPMDPAIAQADSVLRDTVALMAALILLAIAGLAVTVYRLRADSAKERRLQEELSQSLARALSGFIPICSWCNKIRDRESNWVHVDAYVALNTAAEVSHSICPDCHQDWVAQDEE